MKHQPYVLSGKVDVPRALLVTLFVLAPSALGMGALCSAYRLAESFQEAAFYTGIVGIPGAGLMAAWHFFPRLLRWARIRNGRRAHQISYLVALCIPVGSILCRIGLITESGFSNPALSQWFFEEGMYVCGFGLGSLLITMLRCFRVFEPFCENCLQYHELSISSFTVANANVLQPSIEQEDLEGLLSLLQPSSRGSYPLRANLWQCTRCRQTPAYLSIQGVEAFDPRERNLSARKWVLKLEATDQSRVSKWCQIQSGNERVAGTSGPWALRSLETPMLSHGSEGVERNAWEFAAVIGSGGSSHPVHIRPTQNPSGPLVLLVCFGLIAALVGGVYSTFEKSWMQIPACYMIGISGGVMASLLVQRFRTLASLAIGQQVDRPDLHLKWSVLRGGWRVLAGDRPLGLLRPSLFSRRIEILDEHGMPAGQTDSIRGNQIPLVDDQERAMGTYRGTWPGLFAPGWKRSPLPRPACLKTMGFEPCDESRRLPRELVVAAGCALLVLIDPGL